MNKGVRINGGVIQIDVDDLQLDNRYATIEHVADIEYRMLEGQDSVEDIYTKGEIDGKIWSEVQSLRNEWQSSVINTTYQTLEARVLELENLVADYKANIAEFERALRESQPKEENPFYTIIEKVFN